VSVLGPDHGLRGAVTFHLPLLHALLQLLLFCLVECFHGADLVLEMVIDFE